MGSNYTFCEPLITVKSRVKKIHNSVIIIP